MSSVIETCFQKLKENNKPALITYIMAYDPDYQTSLQIMKGLPEAGADIIELGMPFSDPMADGPVIQAAAERALESGATVKNVIAMVAEFRKENKKTPIILMGYYNPVYHYGLNDFIKDTKKAGVDGVIIVDLPPEEEEEFTSIAEPVGLPLIKLVAPTTSMSRAEIILRKASGFIYYISITGITGTKEVNITNLKKSVGRLKEVTKLPVAVGFGIKTPEQVREVGEIADGVVVGSAIVKKIGEKKKPQEIIDFIKELSAGTR